MENAIRYKRIYELEDSKIEQIINDIFKPSYIKSIKKDKDRDEVRVEVVSIFCAVREGKVTSDFIQSDDIITMTDPFIFDGLENNTIFSEIFDDDLRKYKRFCLANGVCEFLKDNEYLV